MENRYQTMYRVTMALGVNGETYNVSPSNIVSVAMIHNYDTMTYPIIRVRLYCDLALIQNITEYPDEITMIGNFDAGVYLIKDQEKPTLVDGATSFSFSMKAYIENKNIPTSKMDQYRDGVKTQSNLNETPKYTIELYGYHQKLIYYMKRQTESIYQNMPLTSVMESMLSRSNIHQYHMDPLNQTSRFDQILIPNLNMLQAFTYFDTYYGLYEKGAHVYGDLDQLYITNASSDVYGNIIPIRIASSQTNADTVGLKKYDHNTYEMYLLFDNVAVLTESDIERIIQAEHIGAVNVNTNEIQTSLLSELYRYKTNEIYGSDNIPNILHKYVNPFVASSNAARIKEKITRVDLSAIGFDIGRMHVNTRYNLLFDSAIRGSNMRGLYRPSFVNHVISNQNDQLFVVQTTMQLCKN